jgi:hypothetical protein
VAVERELNERFGREKAQFAPEPFDEGPGEIASFPVRFY